MGGGDSGGAPLSQRFADSIGADGTTEDAADTVRLANGLLKTQPDYRRMSRIKAQMHMAIPAEWLLRN
jgi:hypothetical protein